MNRLTAQCRELGVTHYHPSCGGKLFDLAKKIGHHTFARSPRHSKDGAKDQEAQADDDLGQWANPSRICITSSHRRAPETGGVALR